VTPRSADPLIGLLELETETGQIELAMNRIVAERLMSTLVEFLHAGRPTIGASNQRAS
jgi:hypothetical protein